MRIVAGSIPPEWSTWFKPDRLELAKLYPRWRGPWSKRQFDADLLKLRQAGLIKDTPDGRCRIASRRILTGPEYHALCSAHATNVCSADATKGAKVCSAHATKDL